MSDVVAIFSGLDEAYGKKTLKLLQSRHSQMYLALFKALFPDTSQGMVADELWSRMDECLSDLEEAGYGELLPKDAGRVKSGRSLCHDLIDRYNWVESKRREDGQMEYRLTSDAIEALETRAHKDLPHLTPGERELYDLLCDPAHKGHRRIEQERIPLGDARAALLESVRLR